MTNDEPADPLTTGERLLDVQIVIGQDGSETLKVSWGRTQSIDEERRVFQRAIEMLADAPPPQEPPIT